MEIPDATATDLDDSVDTQAATQPVVVARLNDPFNSPLISEKRLGEGRCIFVATSADQEWNDWASNFSYLPFLQETVQYAARLSRMGGDVVVGEPLTYPLNPAEYETTAMLQAPDFPATPEISLAVSRDKHREQLNSANRNEAAAQPADAPLQLTFADTDHAGRYRFVLKRRRGGTAPAYAIVNPAAAESDLTPMTESLLRATAPDLEVLYAPASDELIAFADASRSEFWWPLIMATAVVLMSEQIFAWRVGVRQ